MLSEKEIKTITKLAYRLLAPVEIALILEVDKNSFLDELREEGSVVHKAFYTGLLKQENKIKKSSIKPIDVDIQQFREKQLKELKSKLIIQLDA